MYISSKSGQFIRVKCDFWENFSKVLVCIFIWKTDYLQIYVMLVALVIIAHIKLTILSFHYLKYLHKYILLITVSRW